MVSEETCSTYFNKNKNHADNFLSVMNIDQKSLKLPNSLGSQDISIRVDSPLEDTKTFIEDLLEDLCEFAVSLAENYEVTRRNLNANSNDIMVKKQNRGTSIIGQEGFVMTEEGFLCPVECRNNFVNTKMKVRSVSVCEFKNCIMDENENKVDELKLRDRVPDATKEKEKRKKKLSFNSLFHKKDKHKPKESKLEEDSETYDHFPQLPIFKGNTLAKSKKYASAVELNYKSDSTTSLLQRTPSFIKKLVNFKEGSSNFLRRSLSFREMPKKKEKVPSKEKLSEQKAQEWKQSLQSLVESDTSVSYKDMSFVNYDVLNQYSYTEKDSLHPGNCDKNSDCISRTQSMSEKRSPRLIRPSYQRLTSASETYSSTVCLTDYSGALSLPSLHHLEPENVDGTEERRPSVQRYRRRPTSISSEDSGVGSFRSAGACAKLRRHNATRQKVRPHTAHTFVENRQFTFKKPDDVSVRSRSLTHLDALEANRQGPVAEGADSAAEHCEVATPIVAAPRTLKDSRSEPDCTRALPFVAASSSREPSPPTGAVVATPSAVPTTVAPPPQRRHVLSRSQKSSSECFSVNFEVGEESTWDNELFFPAQRGITLHDSLAKLCELRNIDLSSCDARVQDKDSGQESFILFSQDTAALVGRHVRITAKEAGASRKLTGSFQGNHSRKPSGSYRPRTSSFFSSSTEEGASSSTLVGSSNLSLADNEQSRKQIKQRLTAFFGNTKDTKYEGLIEQLDKYSKQGIPQNVNYPQGQCESIDALYKLEDDWRDIMCCSDLTDKQQQQQTALWELIKTEVAYIKTLKVVTDLFLACLKDLQSKNLLKEIDTEKLFSNITDILGANVIFWRNTLFPLVRDIRKYKRPPCLETMLEGFSKLHDTFTPYYKYCAEQSRCQMYCRENLDSEVFAAYLTWCESQKDCNRLRLMDILVQPMQRLTKYGLLLKAILKNTDEDVERESLQTMIKMVDDFVNNVNSSLKHRQDKERLKGIIARIESYDIVDSKDDDIDKILKREKPLTYLDLTRPMLGCPPERKRHLLLEGDLKLKDSGASKTEVHCFLLTDMLLVCKPSTKGRTSSGTGSSGATVRVVRQPYLVDRLVVAELSKETPSLAVIYKNEFDMAVAAFILQSNDARKIKGWKEGIAKAQSLYAQARRRPIGATEDSGEQGEVYPDPGHDYDYYYHGVQLVPRSPLATSSRASRVSSLAHSHSGSVEMNDQSSLGSAKEQSRGVSIENENRTASLSSDEGVQPLPADRSPAPSLKARLLHKTPNTLSVQPYGTLGQSLPNLTLGSPNVGSLSLNLNQNTLSVPNSKNGGTHLLSPTHRGISYPPPSPTRGNLRRSLAISQSNKNPPLIKTRQVNSASQSSVCSSQVPSSFDFDVPVIAGIYQPEDCSDSSFSRGHHRQAMNRTHRYHTAGLVDDIKKNDTRDSSIHKRLSWNCSGGAASDPPPTTSLLLPPLSATPPPPPVVEPPTDTANDKSDSSSHHNDTNIPSPLTQDSPLVHEGNSDVGTRESPCI